MKTEMVLLLGFAFYLYTQNQAKKQETQKTLAQTTAPLSAEQQIQKAQAERDKIAYQGGADIAKTALQSAEKIGSALINSLLGKTK